MSIDTKKAQEIAEKAFNSALGHQQPTNQKPVISSIQPSSSTIVYRETKHDNSTIGGLICPDCGHKKTHCTCQKRKS